MRQFFGENEKFPNTSRLCDVLHYIVGVSHGRFPKILKYGPIWLILDCNEHSQNTSFIILL